MGPGCSSPVDAAYSTVGWALQRLGVRWQTSACRLLVGHRRAHQAWSRVIQVGLCYYWRTLVGSRGSFKTSPGGSSSSSKIASARARRDRSYP